MKLLTNALKTQLLSHAKQGAEDPAPVVKLFTPWANCIWLLTELDPDKEDIAFGLCDLGLGFPELGYVSLSELISYKGPAGLTVKRDIHFKTDKPLSYFVEKARFASCITA